MTLRGNPAKEEKRQDAPGLEHPGRYAPGGIIRSRA